MRWRRLHSTGVFVAMYVTAAALANIGVAAIGPWSMPLIGFIAIGFDLTARDVLHERWSSTGALGRRMTALVLSGSILTALVSPGARRVAAASAIAFLCAGVTDAFVYERMSTRRRIVKMNASNLASASVDSVVFPLIAFGVVEWKLSAALLIAKTGGGAVWAAAINAALERGRL